MNMLYCYLILDILCDVYDDYVSEEVLELERMYVNRRGRLFKVVSLDNTLPPDVMNP